MPCFHSLLVGLAVTRQVLSRPTSQPSNSSLPVIDLGYELHQAASYNATGDYYTFLNIRYAAPPTGDLRFRAPVQPSIDRSIVKNGSEPRVCPQGIPIWQFDVQEVAGEYFAGRPYNLLGFEADIANASSPVQDVNKDTTEDCLFLDVSVPRRIFEQAWIYGGGFALGAKSGTGSESYDPVNYVSDNAMIFVAINYRLGASGWMAGPTLQANGTQNAGLYDQLQALHWIQNNIHLFGGDRSKVTFMGESAGGSSAMLHITAYGGRQGPAPFSQAIPQSPGMLLEPGTIQGESTTNAFLSLLNVTSIAEARDLPSSALITANAKQIEMSSYSTYTYGPVVDGLIMPAWPARLLQLGAFDRSVKVMAGHNAFEGGFFPSPKVDSTSSFQAWLGGYLPNLAPTAASELKTVIYPPIFDGAYGYVGGFSRQAALFGESVFECNAVFLNDAFAGNSYAYEFAVTPGRHTQDLPYRFNEPLRPALYPEVQNHLQQAIKSFVVSGMPQIDGKLAPVWDAGRQQIKIESSGLSIVRSEVNATRCAWWQQDLLA